MSQAGIERYNRQQLWLDVANHLRVAYEALEQAQASLEDLNAYGVDGSTFADQLQPLVDDVRRANAQAVEEVGG